MRYIPLMRDDNLEKNGHGFTIESSVGTPLQHYLMKHQNVICLRTVSI